MNEHDTHKLSGHSGNTIYEKNYKKLLRLAPNLWSLDIGDDLKSRVECYMDLNLDVLEKQDNVMRIALSHYYKHPSGDMIADPDMEMRVNQETQTIEALTFQNSMFYHEVYLDENRFYPALKKSLNSFLGTWLGNCIAQGHQLKRRTEK